MPRPRRRLRWWLKWAGAVLCVVTCIAWVCSFFVPLYPTWLKAETTWFGGLGHGYVECYWPAGRLVSRSGQWFRGECEARWWPMFQSIRAGGGTCWYVGIPVWVVLVAVSVPTIILWRRDRHSSPGYCRKCGYDLTGNVSGICPECGEKVGAS